MRSHPDLAIVGAVAENNLLGVHPCPELHRPCVDHADVSEKLDSECLEHRRNSESGWALQAKIKKYMMGELS